MKLNVRYRMFLQEAENLQHMAFMVSKYDVSITVVSSAIKKFWFTLAWCYSIHDFELFKPLIMHLK